MVHSQTDVAFCDIKINLRQKVSPFEKIYLCNETISLKKEFVKILDKFGHDRLRVKLDIEKGLLIDVVFQYESFIDGQWREMVRYDCAHGVFHRDVIWSDGQKVKTEVI